LRGRARAALLLLLVVAAGRPVAATEGERVLDDFDDVRAWQAVTSSGASLEIASDAGHEGRGMRLDFDFHGAGGYVIARRPLQERLPENYAIHFWLRASAPVNNLEIKLVDASGQNVWWRVQRDFGFPLVWTRYTIRKSQLVFAWGPAGGVGPSELGAIEIAVSASTGGRGSIWIDDLVLEPREPVDLGALHPAVRASSGSAPEAVVDGDPATAWRSAAEAQPQWLELDFGREVDFGGLSIQWDDDGGASAFRVLVSDDGQSWSTAFESDWAGGARSYVPLPDEEARALRIELLRGGAAGYGIRELRLEPYTFSDSQNEFFETVARDAPRGVYPRYLLGEQSYWTVVGVDADSHEALLDEDGRLEVDAGRFTIEPFLLAGGEWIDWADVQSSQELEDGYLPIPSVTWHRGALRLRVTAFAAGKPGASILYARYRVENAGDGPVAATLFLTLRPFQVNPPWQSLNRVGGVARIGQLARRGRSVLTERDEQVVSITPPDAFGATTFERGFLVDTLREGRVPDAASVSDPLGYASGALRYDLVLPRGGAREVWIAFPYDGGSLAEEGVAKDPAHAAAQLEKTTRFWRERLARIGIRLPGPGAELNDTLRANVAYILVNRNGPAIQPGPRDYARSWIRDGALISAALLEMGYADEVRDFLRWFARYQSEDGRIPCCVDARGPDPVAEHDSNGEFIYAVTEYYRYTRDRAFLEEMWPQVVKAVAYIRFLREQTMTSEYSGPDALPAFGLAPESISHEGYSSHPVHSYWDDFFLLRGLKDAEAMARELGDEEHAKSFAELRDAFRTDLYASIERAVAKHNIDFIPGSVELGDFDPTSTSIAVSPGGELPNLPPAELERTFERYFAYFLLRQTGAIEWQSYTPYELRNVVTLIRLGHKKLALQALDFFLGDQRPAGWKEWAEVVWRDPRRPAFIGDMPHAWVGAGFIRSFRSLFVYERDPDRALVIGAGLPRAWIDTPPGVAVEKLPTHYGTVSYRAERQGDGRVRFSIRGDLRDPPDQVVIESPYDEPLAGARVDGREVADFEAHRIVLSTLPSEVIFRYPAPEAASPSESQP
jgi:F5/8 type C domain/Bacterial alpha-L-rhamnosidase 6 hairpin glycosidase domain